MMSRVFLAVAAILAALSVAAGAFTSHILRDRLSDRALDIFETASQYQMSHALAVIAVALILSRAESHQVLLIITGSLFLGGIALFSGSLYLLGLSGVQWFGIITPIGGAAFLGGWVCFAIAAFLADYY